MNYLAERRQEEKERRRAEILDAAEAVATEAGFDALTMDQVARKARLSRALLYIYFKDRTDLHMGLCDRALRVLHARFEEAAARNRTGLDRIHGMGRAYVAFSQEFPVYFEALARFEAHAPAAADVQGEGNVASCLHVGMDVHGTMIRAIGEGMEDGSIRRDAGDPRVIALSLWGFIHGILQIANTKSEVLAAHDVTVKRLIDEALQLAGRAIAAKA